MRKLLHAVLLTLALLPVALAQVYVNDEGTLREIQQIFVNDNGTLREIQEGYVNDNGTLRQFFGSTPAETVTLSGSTLAPTLIVKQNLDPFATASWSFLPDGRVFTDSGAFNEGVEWNNTIPPTGSYWILATLHSGSGPISGDTLNICRHMETTRDWGWQFEDNDVEGSIKVQIFTDDSCTTDVATGYYGVRLCDNFCP